MIVDGALTVDDLSTTFTLTGLTNAYLMARAVSLTGTSALTFTGPLTVQVAPSLSVALGAIMIISADAGGTSGLSACSTVGAGGYGW